MAFRRLGGRRLRRNILVSRLYHLARLLAFLRFAAEVALGFSRKVGFPGGRAPPGVGLVSVTTACPSPTSRCRFLPAHPRTPKRAPRAPCIRGSGPNDRARRAEL